MKRNTIIALSLIGAAVVGGAVGYAALQKTKLNEAEKKNSQLREDLEEATSLRNIIKEKDDLNRRLASSIGFDRAKTYYAKDANKSQLTMATSK